MTLLVDTSAFFGIIVPEDVNHDHAVPAWVGFARSREPLRTHGYVVLETTALLQRRVGLDAVRTFHTDLLPVVSVRQVDAALHERAVTALLAANRRSVSLVDWTSFELMREERIDEAFAFDDDFAEQGFTVRP